MQISKIFLSASLCALFLVGCNSNSRHYNTDTQTNGQDSTQKVVKSFQDKWVFQPIDSNKAGCINDIENGVSLYRQITINNKFKTVDISFSELNCEEGDIDTKITKIYNYTLDTKNTSATKDRTKMYGINLTLEEVNQDDSYGGEKVYLIMGKRDNKLMFVDQIYPNTSYDREVYMQNDLKELHDSDQVIKKFIKE